MVQEARDVLDTLSGVAPELRRRVPEDVHAGERQPRRLQVAAQVPVEGPRRHSPVARATCGTRRRSSCSKRVFTPRSCRRCSVTPASARRWTCTATSRRRCSSKPPPRWSRYFRSDSDGLILLACCFFALLVFFGLLSPIVSPPAGNVQRAIPRLPSTGRPSLCAAVAVNRSCQQRRKWPHADDRQSAKSPGLGSESVAGVRGSRTLPGRRRPPRNGVEDREAHRDPSTPDGTVGPYQRPRK